MHITNTKLVSVSTSLSMSTLTLCLVLAASLTSVICRRDHVKHNIRTQARCKEVMRRPTRNCIWAAGLNSFADQIVERGHIVAYKIQWFNGQWSTDWYVPGVNDLDGKVNLSSRRCKGLPFKANTMRRVWSYFYDHNHKFIICKA